MAVDTIGEVVEIDDLETESQEADAGSEITRVTEESILNEPVAELEEAQKLEDAAEELAEAAGSEEEYTAAGDEPVHVMEAAEDNDAAAGEEE